MAAVAATVAAHVGAAVQTILASPVFDGIVDAAPIGSAKFVAEDCTYVFTRGGTVYECDCNLFWLLICPNVVAGPPPSTSRRCATWPLTSWSPGRSPSSWA